MEADEPETNIVMIELARDDLDETVIAGQLEARGILVLGAGRRRLRAVTHLGIDDRGIDLAVEALADVLAAA